MSEKHVFCPVRGIPVNRFQLVAGKPPEEKKKMSKKSKSPSPKAVNDNKSKQMNINNWRYGKARGKK